VNSILKLRIFYIFNYNT